MMLTATLPALAHDHSNGPVSPQSGPISNNPDDYDLPRYERLHAEAAERLRIAEAQLQRVEQDHRRIADRNAAELKKLDELRLKVESARAAMNDAQEQIKKLQDQVKVSQAQIAQARAEVAPIQSSISEEQRNRDALRTKLGAATETEQRADASARQKEEQARPAQALVEQKRKELEQARAGSQDLLAKVTALETERAGVLKKHDELKAREAGIDAEIAEARKQIESADKEANRLENRAKQLAEIAERAEREAAEAESNGDPEAKAKRVRARNARERANEAQTEVRAAVARAAEARAKETRLVEEKARVARELPELEKKLAQVSAQLDKARQELAQSNPRIQEAEQALAKAQQDAAAVLKAAQEARAEAQQAKQQADSIRQSVTASEQKIQQLETRLKDAQARVTKLQQEIDEAERDIGRQQTRLAKAVNDTQTHSRAFDEQRKLVQAIEVDLRRADQDLERASREAQAHRAATAQIRARMEQVAANLRRAQEIAAADGQADGGADGGAEGARLGADQGARDGADVGEREGRQRGTQEGIARAQTAGREQGANEGALEGAKRGQAEGSTRGRQEGEQRGRTEGLLAGYEQGRAEGDSIGYGEGTKAGHALGGFQKGRAEGLAEGTRRATEEGRANGYREGYAQAEEEFYEADLADAQFENRQGGGGSNVFGHNGQWENLRPRRQYPHPLIQQEYERVYQETFREAAAQAFDQAYEQTYRGAYDQASRVAYERAVSQDYPDEFKAARAAAREEAYNRVYRETYDRAHAESFRPAYEKAYAKALPERRAEGKKDGHREGFERGKAEAYNADLAAGRAEGDREGYEKTYPKAYEQAQKQGRSDATAFFNHNAVLRYDGSLLADANDDGVMAPGETVRITMAIKNYGKSAQKKSVEVILAGASSGLILERPKDVLAPVPGQTRAVITGIAGLKISPQAQVGQTERFQLKVVQDGKELGGVSLSLTVGYPYAIPAVDVARIVSHSQVNHVNVDVRNVSTKSSAQRVKVRLVSLDGLATAVPQELDVGQIGSGQTRAAQLGFTFPEANAYRTLGFEIQILEGGWLLGKRRFQVDATKQWMFNENAAGLLVVGSSEAAKDAETASRIAGLAYDVWDVRIEGELRAEIAAKYAGKALVLPLVSRALGEGTARAVEEYLIQGGHILAGTALDSNSVSSVIEARSRGLERSSLAGLSFAQANYFRQEQQGSSVLAQLDSEALRSPEALAEDLVTFELVTQDIVEKTTSYLRHLGSGVTERAERARQAILRDLIKEMEDDKEVKGDNYKKNKGALLLTAFINTALTKQGEERKALVKLYPELDSARKKIGWLLSTRRARIKKVLKPLSEAYKRQLKGKS